MIACFVDIGEIVDHNCLNVLFIIRIITFFLTAILFVVSILTQQCQNNLGEGVYIYLFERRKIPNSST